MNSKIQQGRIYGRFSSKPQERGDSRRRQIEGARQYAERSGVQIVGEPYFDEAVSGKDGANLEKEFGRLLRESKPGEAVLCEALDRIGRQNPFILGKLVYDLVAKGVTVIAWQEGKVISRDNIDTLETQFSVFTGAAVGHADNVRKMKRLRETTSNAIAQGEKGIQSGTLVKYLPQCFLWDESSKSIKLDTDKAEVIRRIFDMFNSGTGKTTICQKLSADKVPTLYKSGWQIIGTKRPWLETSVTKVLKNESYAGVLIVKNHKITCIPSVVSRETFDKAQLLLQRYSNRSGKTSGRVNNLFNGLSICKHCEGTVNVSVSPAKRPGNKTARFFRCKNARLKQCNHHKMLNVEIVEHLFFMMYFGGSPEHIAADSNQLNVKIDAVNAKIERLTKAINGLYDMAEEGDKEAKDRIAARRIEKAEAEQELVLLKGQTAEQEHLPSMMEEVIKMTVQGKSVDWTEWNIALMDKLADDNIRLRLRSILPSIFEKVIFDTTARTVEGILRKGVRLPNTMIKEGPILLPVGGKFEATIGDGKMMLGYKEPPPGKVLVELK